MELAPGAEWNMARPVTGGVSVAGDILYCTVVVLGYVALFYLLSLL